MTGKVAEGDGMGAADARDNVKDPVDPTAVNNVLFSNDKVQAP